MGWSTTPNKLARIWTVFCCQFYLSKHWWVYLQVLHSWNFCNNACNCYTLSCTCTCSLWWKCTTKLKTKTELKHNIVNRHNALGYIKLKYFFHHSTVCWYCSWFSLHVYHEIAELFPSYGMIFWLFYVYWYLWHSNDVQAFTYCLPDYQIMLQRFFTKIFGKRDATLVKNII